MKAIILHVGLLALSSATALSIWLRDEEAEMPKSAQVEVWSGKPESVEAIAYDSKTRKLRLEPKRDELGRWYVARLEKTEEAPVSAHPPEDAGAPPPENKPKQTTQSFIAVKEADELVKKLAPMMALRSVGKLEAPKAADFGLDQPEGTLKVKIAGREHVLTIGGQTPGGGERYAKYASSNEVFAIPSDLTQSLAFADSRLMERDLHGFSPEDVQRVVITNGTKTRELVRVTGKQDAWADAATPTKADETLVNWMSKLDRLRVTEYVEKPASPPKPQELALRVEYFGASKPLGRLELYKVTAEKGPEYLARTPYGRWYVKVVNSAAEQVDRDLPTLLK